MTEDQYTAIASLKRDHRFAGAAISFPSWEKLVGENSEFVWAIYGGWLGSLRFGFAANSVRNGDSLYIKILEIFERLTLHLPRCGDKKGRKMPVTHMKFCHIRDGWFELSLVHTSTERRAKSLVSEEVKCERAGMKLVQEAAATTRTADPIPNSFDEWFPCTWTACVLSNCLQKKGLYFYVCELCACVRACVYTRCMLVCLGVHGYVCTGIILSYVHSGADMLKDEPEPPKVYQLEVSKIEKKKKKKKLYTVIPLCA